MQKQVLFNNRGMQRDLTVSKHKPEYAYENQNIRITPVDDNTLLSVVNEKGNKKLDIVGIEEGIIGIPIGQAILNDELTLFVTGDIAYKETGNIIDYREEIPEIIAEESPFSIESQEEDRIYKVWYNEDILEGKLLFKGTLGLDYRHPIETISIYENENIKKIYWTDGINQPRVINTEASQEVIDSWTSDSFNFVRSIVMSSDISIKRNLVANGSFSPGIIQYCFTYFNKYMQETNIFHTSPLYYTSFNNRGASPEDKIGNNFNITINNVDTNFDYIRIYSIHRTSLDATPTVKHVVDLSTKTESSYIIDGTLGYNLEITSDNIYPIIRDSLDSSIPLSNYTPSIDFGSLKQWSLNSDNYAGVLIADGNYNILVDIGNTMTISINNNSNTTISFPGQMTIESIDASSLSYTDNGDVGTNIDPTELLYVGGEEVIFATMAHKDNVLFSGNIKLLRKTISDDIKNYFKNGEIVFSNTNKELSTPEAKGYYPYENQLMYNSREIKTFKYLETYRFGVQFQHKTGKWSEPVWVNDIRNTTPLEIPYNKEGKIIYPTAKYILKDSSIIGSLLSAGYVNVRPVVVYPTLSDRECICQGVLCPTVFNVEDRYNNSPSAYSSWYTRPNGAFSIRDTYTTRDFRDRNTGIGDVWDGDPNTIKDLNGSTDSRACLVNNNTLGYGSGTDSVIKFDLIPLGASVANLHHEIIPGTGYTDSLGNYIATRGGEIQCVSNPPLSPLIPYSTENDIINWVSNNGENFFVDQSVLTLHSPDIEFNTDVRSIDSSNLKLRIVGLVPLTSSISDIDIQTSTPANKYKDTSELAPGFYKENIGSSNISRFGFRTIVNGAFWFDSLEGQSVRGNPQGFAVYPWHRNGSLNSTKENNAEGYKSALLDKKKMSTLRYSYNSFYFESNQIWNAFELANAEKQGISGITIFDSNEVTLSKIPAPKNSGISDVSYYGNVDKIITPSLIGKNIDGYPIVTTGYGDVATSSHNIFVAQYQTISIGGNRVYGIDPVSMKYKSTPHAVMALNYTEDNKQRVLPTLYDGDINSDGTITLWEIDPVNTTFGSSEKLFWDKNSIIKGISQEAIKYDFSNINNSYNGYGPEYGYLWIGELYNDTIDVNSRFGGRTTTAFENNQWLPCGDAVSIIGKDSLSVTSVEIEWSEGDTYYQRYDHLKTYPFTLEDQNSMVDIVSFMCETRINLDGRYDKNRGQDSNLVMTPTNFNLLNTVYSQQDNFFTYRGINSLNDSLDDFYNVVTWSKTKTLGEEIDVWTNTTLASTLDLDGDKGVINSIKRFNNELIAIQDRGISNILFNSRTQLAVNDGVPVEIANSGKVDGKIYISDTIGCNNKWSICETPNGLYFVDDYTKSMYLYNGRIQNISDTLGFHSWINKKSTTLDSWNPVDFNNFVAYYDKINREVLFISKETCLAYSELLNTFTSFYNYENMTYFSNLKNKGLGIKGAVDKDDYTETVRYRFWGHHEGDYNMFFDTFKPFYTTIIVNPDSTKDKVFNNLEFRADTFDTNNVLLDTTFDKLYTWNEYQLGESSLTNIFGRPSSLKKKFRIWRTNIPRSKENNRDRMRNPWLYIKLAKEEENIDKTILHDMVVSYFD